MANLFVNHLLNATFKNRKAKRQCTEKLESLSTYILKKIHSFILAMSLFYSFANIGYVHILLIRLIAFFWGHYSTAQSPEG